LKYNDSPPQIFNVLLNVANFMQNEMLSESLHSNVKMDNIAQKQPRLLVHNSVGVVNCNSKS